MSLPKVAMLDLAEVLARLLGGIDDLRAYAYVSDATRPPAAVIGQPEIDFLDTQAGFCSATWTFPVMLVVARNSDREAQKSMSRLLHDVVEALGDVEPEGIHSIEPVDARPITVSIGQQELPAYNLNVRVRA